MATVLDSTTLEDKSIATEIKLMVAGVRVGTECQVARGGVTEMFYVLIVVVVTEIYTFVRTQQIVPLK